MPKKTNNRKAIQAAKRKADAVADAREKRKALLALLMGAGALQVMVERKKPPA